MDKVIVISGPTASGKSSLAIELANQIDGEIICADSRQIYQHMVIGAASPSQKELNQAVHHGFNHIHPQHKFDAAQFIKQTDQLVNKVLAKNKRAIVVGGSGLYLRCWRYGLSDVPKFNENIKNRIRDLVNEKGYDWVYQNLQRIDKTTADKISINDHFRIARAYGIYLQTGEIPSKMRTSHLQKKPRFNALWFLLNPEKTTLNQRIYLRVEQMFAQGLIAEALHLRKILPGEHSLLKTMGYKEALECADGKLSLDEAINKTVISHRQYAKRQMTWFKKEPWWCLDKGTLNAALVKKNNCHYCIGSW